MEGPWLRRSRPERMKQARATRVESLPVYWVGRRDFRYLWKYLAWSATSSFGSSIIVLVLGAGASPSISPSRVTTRICEVFAYIINDPAKQGGGILKYDKHTYYSSFHNSRSKKLE